MKIIFAVFLFIVFVFSILYLISLENPSYGAHIFVIVSFIAFTSHFAVSFLGLEIDGKIISLKKQVQSLENSQKELMLISTAFYKLSMVNLVIGRHQTPPPELIIKHSELTKELDKYLDLDDVADFTNKLFDTN